MTLAVLALEYESGLTYQSKTVSLTRSHIEGNYSGKYRKQVKQSQTESYLCAMSEYSIKL